jgi:hypothetical protein
VLFFCSNDARIFVDSWLIGGIVNLLIAFAANDQYSGGDETIAQLIKSGSYNIILFLCISRCLKETNSRWKEGKEEKLC